MPLNTRNETVVDVSDWDALVQKTYLRPYMLQQQNGCMDRQRIRITVPDVPEDFETNSVPEEVNGAEMGVRFAAWLARDPKQPLANERDQDSWSIDLWWERNFYPDLQMVANDLHARGLLDAGKYTIDIDW